MEISDQAIRAFATKYPAISGRDVKNLIKLASFIAAKDGKPIELSTLEFALKYKPTANVSGDPK